MIENIIGLEKNNKKIIAHAVHSNKTHPYYLIKCLLCNKEMIGIKGQIEYPCICLKRKNRVKIGDKFGHLVVSGEEFIDKDQFNKWVVPCDCTYLGCTVKNKPVIINHLIHSYITSCGCLKSGKYKIGYIENNRKLISVEGVKDGRRIVKVECLTCKKIVIGVAAILLNHPCRSCVFKKYRVIVGQKFEFLTVINDEYRNEDGFWVAECKCICGKIKTIAVKNLYTNLKTCGCRYSTPRTEEEQWKIGFDVWKYRIKRDNRKSALFLNEWVNLSKSNCYICGCKPMQPLYQNGGSEKKNGLDRIDSSKEYTIENCRPCCKFHNIMKKNYSFEKFMNLCLIAVNHQIKLKLENKENLDPIYKEISDNLNKII